MRHYAMLGAALVLARAAVAGWTPTVDLSQGPNGVLAPVAATVTTEISVCYAVGLPYGVGNLEIRTAQPDFSVGLELNMTDEPNEVIMAICGRFPPCVNPPIDLCGVAQIDRIDYGLVRGGISLGAAAAGGGFSGGNSYRRIARAQLQYSETLVITAPTDMMLELPIVAGGGVFGAETFGNPDETWGRAKLAVTGSIAGQPVSLLASVNSVSVIPEQASINAAPAYPLAVAAGLNHFIVDLTALAEVDVKATSAGLFGTITAAATAGANFGDTLVIGRIRAAGGGPLPAGVIVTAAGSGAELENTVVQGRPVVLGGPPLTVCTGGTAELTVTASGPGELSYEWHFAGDGAYTPIMDGPGGSGESVSGAATGTLTIHGASIMRSGNYYCLVRNESGTTVSPPQQLAVCQVGDSNADGVVNFDDISCFVVALIDPVAWATCAIGSAEYACVNDANYDGRIDFDDIEGFIVALISGQCP